MKTFATTLTKAGNSTISTTVNSSIKDILVSSFKQALNEGMKGNVNLDVSSKLNQHYSDKFDTIKEKELLNFNVINISNYSKRTPESNFLLGNILNTFEDQMKIPSNILNTFNRYKYIYKNSIDIKSDIVVFTGPDNEPPPGRELYVKFQSIAGTPSLFSPYFSIAADGITKYVPLLNESRILNGTPQVQKVHPSSIIGQTELPGPDGIKQTRQRINDFSGIDLQNCSIKRLVEISNDKSIPEAKILGLARYRYSDFMFCKDLGTISNNHLITLRRFPHPVNDNIFIGANGGRKNKDEDHFIEGEPDVARLVTWFGTEDNQLENIMKYDYSMSWKELKAQIEEQQSKEDDHQSILGQFINSTSGVYNKYQEKGFTGGNNIISRFAGQSTGIFGKAFGTDGYQDKTILSNYDNNKVYEPKNTIQDTVLYEGKLTFNQEINLTFCYKLRAYDNINPKSAFLDLLGNILEVTYRRGRFWGGSRKVVGPPQNTAGWKKAHNFINNAWDQLGGFVEAMARGNLDWGSVLGSVTEAVSKAYNSAKNLAQKVQTDPKAAANEFTDYMQEINHKTHFTDALRGQLLNTLGRPAIYAWQSYLSGDDVGLWHLTIGNPLNPIAAFGNLIMTNASIQHSGPLGIDDFPSELKVIVTLKHARSRDITEIGRMYTRGWGGIYALFGMRKLANYIGGGEGSASSEYVNAEETAMNANQYTQRAQQVATSAKHAEYSNQNNPKDKDGKYINENYKDFSESQRDDIKKVGNDARDVASQHILSTHSNVKIDKETGTFISNIDSPGKFFDDSIFSLYGTDDIQQIKGLMDEIA